LIKHQIPALTRHRLTWVRQNYIRAETLVRANAKLVNHQATIPLAKKWGGGDVASADGMRFVTPVRTVNAGPNKKYFTLYLLNYIDDEDYRRRILTQLNRGEGRHAVARIICHGQRGEIRKRYREGQEDQLGALGLVTNAVVLWNTIYMDAARNHLEQQSIVIKEEDEARLSPLQHEHINVLGHYSFTLSDVVMKGQLRPFNKLPDNIEIP